MEKSVNQVARGSTMFIQADKTSFRELVQRLTGPHADCVRQTSTASPTNEETNGGAAVKVTGIKRPTSRLHERREYTRSKLEIVKPGLSVLETSQTGFQLTGPVFSLSPSGNLDFTTSPLSTPSKGLLNLSISGEEDEEEKAKSAVSDLDREEEEKAIRERRFYLHLSPKSRPGNIEPELLPLFPLTSPKQAHQS